MRKQQTSRVINDALNGIFYAYIFKAHQEEKNSESNQQKDSLDHKMEGAKRTD